MPEDIVDFSNAKVLKSKEEEAPDFSNAVVLKKKDLAEPKSEPYGSDSETPTPLLEKSGESKSFTEKIAGNDLPKAPEFKTKGQGVLEQPTKELPSNILEAAPPRNIAEKPVHTTSMKAVEDAIETTKTAWKALHKGWKQGELSAKFNETLESGQIAKWNPHYKEYHAKDLEELASISNDVDKIHQTKGVQDFENAEHGHESWEAFKKNPVDVLTSIILTSGASLLSSTLNEKASSSNSPVEMPMVNPAQLMAEKGYNLGMASDMMASLHEAGVDFKNPKSIKSALEDENKIAEIYKKANDRNVPIAIVDMMTGTLASKIVGKMAKTAMPTILNRAKQIATGSAIETTGAMGGEGLAQVNSEGKITSIQDILLEGAGELGQGAPNIATGIFANEDGAVQVQEPASALGAMKSRAKTPREIERVQKLDADIQNGIESKRAEILASLPLDENNQPIVTPEAKIELEKLENARVQVQEPTQQSATDTEGAQSGDVTAQQQESVVQPTSPETNQGAIVESAVIEIGGETFEGKNHAEAILKAQQAGKDISQVDRKGQGMFKLSDGSVISRDEAKATFGADRAEMLIPQDEASNQANSDYEKVKRQVRTIENIEFDITTTVDEIRNNPSVELAQKLTGLNAEKNALNKAVNINSDLANSQNGISGSQNSGGANVINQATGNAEKSGTTNAEGVPNGEKTQEQQDAQGRIDTFISGLEETNTDLHELALKDPIAVFNQLIAHHAKNLSGTNDATKAYAQKAIDKFKALKKDHELANAINTKETDSNIEDWIDAAKKQVGDDKQKQIEWLESLGKGYTDRNEGDAQLTESAKISLTQAIEQLKNEPTQEQNLQASVLDQSGTENSKTESGAEQVRKTVLGEKFYDQTSDQVTKDALARYGLDRSVKNQKEALDSARKLVQDIGIEAAREAFISDRTIFGDNRVALWGVLVEDAQNEQISAKTEDEYFRATNKLAELVDLGSEYATSLGQGSSMFRAVYDMLGVEYGASEQIRKYKKEHDGIIPKSLEDKFTEIANKLAETEKKLQEVEKQLEQKTVEASIAAIKNEANKSESTKKRKEIAKKKAEDGLAEFFGALATLGGGKLSAVDANESLMHGAIQAIEAFMELQKINFEEAYNKFRAVVVSKKFDPKKLDDIKDSLREQVKANTIEDDLTDTSRLKISRKLLRELAQQTTNVDEFTGLVREAIKDEYPNATDREIHDAISGYGQTIKASKADGAKELAKLKNLMRAHSQLEDIAKGQWPKKTGFQREPTDADVRAKFNEVREAMKTLPLDPETKEGLLKSAQNAYETRLKNRMADLRREIDNNQKQKKTPSQIQKNTELEDKLSELKAEHDLHFKAENEAEKADNKERASEKRLADKIAELESEIEEGKLKEKADNPKMTAWSPKIAEKQKKLSELKAEHDTVLAEAKKVTRDKKRIESSKRNIHRRIAELTRRMAENDFASKQPVPFPEDAARRKLLAEKEDLIEDFDNAKEKWEHENRDMVQKAKDGTLEAWNLARLVGSGADLGLIFIQGANYTIANAIKKPSVLWKAIKTSKNAVANRYKQEKAASDMKGQDWYRDAKKAGLYMEDPNSRKQEEGKLNSNLVSKIWKTLNPFRWWGKEAPAFARAWDANNIAEIMDDFSGAYMNVLRTQKWIDQREMLLKEGKTIENDPKSYKDVAGTINMFSGKSKLNVGGVDASAMSGGLGLVLYSPKNWASVLKQTTPLGLINFAMMTENTHEGYKMSRAQKMAVSDFSAMIAGTLGIVALYALKYENDDDEKTKVNYTDPTRPDFLKPKRRQKDGDIVMLDVWGGKLGSIILQARLYTGKYSTTNNPEKRSLGSGMYTPTAVDLTIQHVMNKLHPSLGGIVKPYTLRKKMINDKEVRYDHFEGKAYDWKDAIRKLYTPMIAEAQMQMYDHDPKAIDIFDSFLILIGAANVQAAKGKK